MSCLIASCLPSLSACKFGTVSANASADSLMLTRAAIYQHLLPRWRPENQNDLLPRLLPPDIETLALAGDMTKPRASWHRSTSALMHFADTIAQRPKSAFDALKQFRCNISIAQALNDTAVPELFNAASVILGYED